MYTKNKLFEKSHGKISLFLLLPFKLHLKHDLSTQNKYTTKSYTPIISFVKRFNIKQQVIWMKTEVTKIIDTTSLQVILNAQGM